MTAVTEKNRLVSFLEEQSQEAWSEALEALEPSIHPVDRLATRIWFAFWPLDLNDALAEGAEEEMARVMDLEGDWRLVGQLDASVAFFYGAHHWPAVKNTVSTHDLVASSLSETIRYVASKVAEREAVDLELVLGITAVGLMALRQVGPEVIENVADRPAEGELLPKDPEKIVRNRARKSRDGLFTFLKGVNRRFQVRWDERRRNAVFRAFNGQDIAMAAAQDPADYRGLDYRRIEGPVPVECRIGSCGYCWVGVLAGRENLSEMSPYERERLRYFGYDTANDDDDPRPLIRLSCQAACHGDVTIVIPSWNGELNRRHDQAPKKLGTA